MKPTGNAVGDQEDAIPSSKKRRAEKFEIPELPKGKILVDDTFNTDVETLFKVNRCC